MKKKKNETVKRINGQTNGHRKKDIERKEKGRREIGRRKERDRKEERGTRERGGREKEVVRIDKGVRQM